LQIDTVPLRRRLLSTIDELSKHIHGRENTIIRDQSAQDAIAAATAAAMAEFLDVIRECRAAVLGPIAEALDDAAVNALITDTLGDVDEIASHYSLDDVYVGNAVVHSIGPDNIIYRVTGSVAVTLQWGSNSDVRRGDGVELDQSFPFYCDIEVPLSEPWDLGFAEVTFGVDTQGWRERTGPDDFDG
jgi:Predicted pPIWI-associating nuclease